MGLLNVSHALSSSLFEAAVTRIAWNKRSLLTNRSLSCIRSMALQGRVRKVQQNRNSVKHLLGWQVVAISIELNYSEAQGLNLS